MFKFIFNTIFFFISIKNYLKILNGKNINNFYLPNISIKNIIFINPSKIKYKGTTHIKFKKRSTPFIFDFDWDKKNQDLLNFEKQHHTYISCKELFIKNFELKNCKEYFFFKEQIQKFGEFKGCKTESDIILYLKKLLKLFGSIKKYGIKTNIDNNLDFMIDRHGNLVKIGGGNHRFAISRILKLNKIPIEIKLINSQFLNKKYKKIISIKDLNNMIKNIENRYN
jgi:hypothetical protein